MRRQLAFALLAPVLALTLFQFMILLKTRASAGSSKVMPTTHQQASLGYEATVHARGRGASWINLADGRELLPAYTGHSQNEQASQRDELDPRALASADFDEDGVPDLISAYAGSSGGVITLHRGNIDSIHPNSAEAKRRKTEGVFIDAPLLSPDGAFEIAEEPGFMAAGDFDADGHCDVVTAARGGELLRFLPGDGRGEFRAVRAIALPGRVTAMVSGEINRRDGLTDLVVGITSADGPKVLVFEGPRGALEAQPEAFALPAKATALTLAQLDDDPWLDLAIAAGKDLLVVQGRDRKLSIGKPELTPAAQAKITHRKFRLPIRSIAAGSFTESGSTELALLTDDGRIHLLTQEKSKGKTTRASGGNQHWNSNLLLQSSWPRSTQLAPMRGSNLRVDTLVVMDSTNHQLHMVARNTGTFDQMESSSVTASLDVEGEPAVVLPMRLNADALSDLVILRRGRIAPTVMIAAPALNFVVSNTGDNGGVNPAPGAATGTLRQAIVDANANAGADTISFSIGAGAQTISLAAQLPIIADPVTIDGTTQPGFAGTPIIELIGGATIPSGLTIDAGNSTVKGLVINSFILAGILLQTNGGNIVEGNYLGTELNGSIALPNGTGITIDGVPNNLVGGTTAAARNLISGNAQIGIFINGSGATGNIVQGNFVGTNAAGTAGLGNAIGISVSNQADATIGGTAAGARNIISANGSVGVVLILSVSGTLVQGNFIGTDINGVAGLGNNEAGVQVSNSSPNNTLGGTTAAARNIVSGNNNKGFQINGSGTNGNLVQGNFIGTQVDGNTALGNTLSGVSIEASATNNTVGGSLDSVNIIAFNGTDGVAISSGSGNAVLFNSIFSNANLGINISDDPGVTPNDLCDPDPGPNGLQNFPVLTSANSSGGNTVIVGTLNSTDATTFRIEFFSSPACDPSGNGEGKTFIGLTNVSTPAAICDTPINVSFPVTLAAGSVITATATDPSNSTSEFSACVTVAATCVITCPPNQTQSNDPNQCGAVVTYPPPTADVSCGTVTCIPASGSFFPTGTTTVNCTTGAGPSCSFTVTVNDTQAPTITCPPTQTVPATSPAGAVVNYPAPTVSDNCPNASPACSPPSGSTFPVGSTTVNCTATDESTNTSSCSFTVNVTAQADLGVTNVDSPDPVMAGSNLTYTITVTNGGPQPATNVALSTSVPTGTAFVSASVSQGTFTAPAPGSSGPVNWTVGTITLGSSATMTLIVNVTAGPTITNNATVSGSSADPNPANDSATAITTVGACALACPADVVFGTGPNATGCGAVFSYSAVPSGSCGAVTCAPPSGSVFIVGTTAVSCTVSGGPSCSFNVTVIDDTAPRVFCSGSLSTSTLPGQSTALVNYPAATVTDNCSGASVECAPPSGTRFPIGSTIVTCTGTDSASNTTRCSFNIIVIDSEGPIITCPANVSVAPASGQNSIVVTYPAPTVTDNLPGVSALCAPSSGSSFPVGVTTVTCVATDAQGNKASCAFSVSVGGPLARVIIPGGKTAIEFGTPTPVTPSRKPPKPKKKPCSFLSIENIGFAPLVLTLDSIARVGSDVDSKKISDPNDAGHFSLSLVNADQSLTPVDIGGVVTIPTGRTQTFCLQFSALIPALAGKSTGLTANEALPDTVNARITFRQNAGSPLTVSLLSHVSTALILIDPANPRRPAVVGFTRSGNEITVSFAVFDPNLDVSRAKYEFLDNNGSVVGEAFEIDLAEPVRALNLVRGQSFSVEQRFTNAADHPEITGVRLTVFDAETSVTAPSSASTPDTVSIRLIGPGRGVTLYPPTVSLSPRPR